MLKWKLFTIAMMLPLMLFVFAINDASAYVDPGTAGYLYQILFVVFSGIAGVFVFFRDRIIGLFRGQGRSKKDKD